MRQGFLRTHSNGILALTWVADLGLTLASCFAAMGLTGGLSADHRWVVALALALSAAYYPAFSLYRTRRGESFLLEFRVVLIATLAVFVSVTLIAAITDHHELFTTGWYLLWWCLSVFALSMYRLLGVRC